MSHIKLITDSFLETRLFPWINTTQRVQISEGPSWPPGTAQASACPTGGHRDTRDIRSGSCRQLLLKFTAIVCSFTNGPVVITAGH